MSNVTIPDLPPGAGPTAASQFESVEGVASVRYTAAQIVGAGSSGTFLAKANNLSDVPDKAAARTNLGVTATGADVAYAYRANNLSDLASIPTARTNLGITASGADAAYVWRTNNLSDLTNITTARTNLGLGTAAVKNTGTSGNTVPLLDGANTFSGATNVFNGNVGIGVTPICLLDAGKNQNSATVVRLSNMDTGNASRAVLQLSNTVGVSNIQMNGQTYVDTPMDIAGGMSIVNAGNGISLYTTGASPILFGTLGLERMQIDAAGNVQIGATAPYQGERLEVIQTPSNPLGILVKNTFTSGNSHPLKLLYSSASPNNAASVFVDCVDTVGEKAALFSNGGIGNYSANNVNLSDANVKDQITPYSKTELAALEQSFTNVIWGKFKYRDQTHDDWNHGPTAQGVERAFENSAPELVDESELGTTPESGVKHKVIYETDLAHIAHALLANVLKSHANALTRISDLEARLAAVGA